MESKAKLLGHPIHPMLIVFPLGLLATSVAFDIVGLSNGVLVSNFLLDDSSGNHRGIVGNGIRPDRLVRNSYCHESKDNRTMARPRQCDCCADFYRKLVPATPGPPTSEFFRIDLVIRWRCIGEIAGGAEQLQHNHRPITFSVGAVTFLKPPERVQRADEIIYSVKESVKHRIHRKKFPWTGLDCRRHRNCTYDRGLWSRW